MELRIENNRGFWSQKTIVCNEIITLVRNIDNKYDVYLCFKNGSKNAKIKANYTFAIPSEVFIDGVLETNVEIYFQGTLVKRIPCDRLIIQDTDNELKAIPEVDALKSIMEEQGNTIKELKSEVEELSNKLDFFIKLWKEEL